MNMREFFYSVLVDVHLLEPQFGLTGQFMTGLIVLYSARAKHILFLLEIVNGGDSNERLL